MIFIMNIFSLNKGRYQIPVTIQGKKKLHDTYIVLIRFNTGNTLWMPVADFEHKCIVTLNLRKIKNRY